MNVLETFFIGKYGERIIAKIPSKNTNNTRSNILDITLIFLSTKMIAEFTFRNQSTLKLRSNLSASKYNSYIR